MDCPVCDGVNTFLRDSLFENLIKDKRDTWKIIWCEDCNKSYDLDVYGRYWWPGKEKDLLDTLYDACLLQETGLCYQGKQDFRVLVESYKSEYVKV